MINCFLIKILVDKIPALSGIFKAQVDEGK